MRRANRSALRDLRGTQSRFAQDTASSLRGALDSFDRDTRLLATLATSTRSAPIAERAQDDAILHAFEALATVVPHYRTIALFHAGRRPLVAVDPTEDPVAIAPALVAASERLAAEAATDGGTARSGPLSLGGGRAFYLHAAADGAGEAVVVSSDAAMMLESISRRPTDAGGLVLVDPNGAAWIGCEQRQRCRLVPPGSPGAAAILATIDTGTRGESVVADPRVARLGLPARAIVGVAPRAESALGAWSVASIAPADDLDHRQRAILWQLVATVAGVAVVILAIGVLILRQHAQAAALRGQLQAAEQVARLQRQLVRAEKLVTVGVLSAGIAHEIGTPLAVVRGRAEHMLERPTESRDEEDLRAIVGEIDRVSSTIRQVLEFSREQPATVGRTDPRAAVARALELLEWRLAARRVLVDVDVPAELPPLAAAADQFEQVLVNLLMNACDASRSGSGVRVTARRDGIHPHSLRFEVVDRGGGIPPHHLNAVFDPYFTTKKRGEGTGLGLAIVAQIVRSHRGEVAIRSAIGVGTAVVVIWPIAREHEKMTEQVRNQVA
ncbi:MAG TPA: HAMP domain-containing sensor histidine kinase [Polyangia bacterium]|nr:HAMP domain-containing sensor histidine kinase [Polyangia bacterium]